MKFEGMADLPCSTTMSGIRMKTELTHGERKAIQSCHTVYPPDTGSTVVHEKMDTKLLLCILETLQDIKEELATLRASNTQMKHMLQNVMTGSSIKVQNQN